jgi:hypothetical protein
MRTSYLVGFAAASILSAGAVGFGCSSSSSSGSTPTDAGGTSDTATTEDGGEDTGTTDSGSAEAAACTPAPIDVATFDSGSPAWACYQANCATALTACAADCVCNAGIAGALECAADGGASATMTCFVTAFGNLSSDTPGTMVESCVVTNMTGACAGTPATDGGGDAAPTTDGGTPADTGASDTGAGPG